MLNSWRNKSPVKSSSLPLCSPQQKNIVCSSNFSTNNNITNTNNNNPNTTTPISSKEDEQLPNQQKIYTTDIEKNNSKKVIPIPTNPIPRAFDKDTNLLKKQLLDNFKSFREKLHKKTIKSKAINIKPQNAFEKIQKPEKIRNTSYINEQNITRKKIKKPIKSFTQATTIIKNTKKYENLFLEKTIKNVKKKKKFKIIRKPTENQKIGQPKYQFSNYFKNKKFMEEGILKFIEPKNNSQKIAVPLISHDESFADTLYHIRYGIIPAREIFNLCSPNLVIFADQYEDISIKEEIGRLYVQKFNEKVGFYEKLEKSILQEGFRNPILVTAGYPKWRKKEDVDETFFKLKRKEDLLFCEILGGSRLFIAQKHNWLIPVIISDFTGKHKNFYRIRTVEELKKCYYTPPEKIEFTSLGVKTTPPKYIHLEEEWDDPKKMSKIRNEILSSEEMNNIRKKLEENFEERIYNEYIRKYKEAQQD